jgi:hypothetical protein
LRAWQTTETDGYIRVLDSSLHVLSSDAPGAFEVHLGGRTLTIEADDGEQPTLLGDVDVFLDGGRIELAGVLHEGRMVFQSGGIVSLHHVTARDGIEVKATDLPLSLSADRCILGSVCFATLFGGAEFQDCVLGLEGGFGVSGGGKHENAPAACFLRCTVLGEVRLGEMPEARDSLFTDHISVRRRHVGSMHSCAIPADSETCRRVHCFEFWVDGPPNTGPHVKDSLPPPSFVSSRFGDPGFAQLGADAHANFRSGASNGHELGVYNTVRQHDRLRFLRASVHEYLPVGWWADIQFVN